MKRKLRLLIVLSAFLLFMPLARADEYYSVANSGYYNIEDPISLNIGNNKLVEKAYVKTQYRTFEVKNYVINDSDYASSIKYTVSFYDSDFNLIDSAYKSFSLSAGYKTFFSQSIYMELDEFEKVKYYSIDVEKNELIYKDPISRNCSFDYVIDKYDLNIVVNEDNILKVKENIDVYYNKKLHGFFIEYPLRNVIESPDGTTTVKREVISDFRVNDDFEITNKNGYKLIKIGSPTQKVFGLKNYEIEYKYNLGRDQINGKDEFYYNIIEDWDTTINNLTFTITMPKDFDDSNLTFYCNDDLCDERLVYQIKDNVIVGEYIGEFSNNHNLSLYLELPEDYFVGATTNVDSSFKVMVGIPLLFLAISFLIWFKYGREYKRISTIEFYPPDGLNSLDIALIYKNKVKISDVMTLIIYLANKGYLKIVEEKDQKFIVEKIKDYDGNNDLEKLFLEGLFKKKDKVSSDYIAKNFYSTVAKILYSLKTEKEKNLYESMNRKKSLLVVVAAIISVILIVTIPVFPFIFLDSFVLLKFIISIMILIFIAVIFLVILINTSGDKVLAALMFYIPTLIFAIYFIGLVPVLLIDSLSILGVVVGATCIVSMAFFAKNMPKRTIYCAEMLARIKGFKRFLVTVEKDKLEEMVLENPNYFYDILPYTYVLGVSDKWIKKFTDISIISPEIHNYSSVDYQILNHIIKINIHMTSSRSSSSSSSSSGRHFRSSSRSYSSSSSRSGSGGGRRGSW